MNLPKLTPGRILAKIPTVWRIPVIAFAGLLLALLVWFYGMKVWNGVGNWMYHHSENEAKAEISKIKDEAAATKKVAQDAIAAFEAEKLITAEERKKRELAEKTLADKTKNTDQKLAAYETAIAARPTVTGPESTDELCKRAAALGLSCR